MNSWRGVPSNFASRMCRAAFLFAVLNLLLPETGDLDVGKNGRSEPSAKARFLALSPVRKADLEGPLRVDSAHCHYRRSKPLRSKREDQVNRFSKTTEAWPPGQARRRSPPIGVSSAIHTGQVSSAAVFRLLAPGRPRRRPENLRPVPYASAIRVAASNFPVMKASAMRSQRPKPQSHKVVQFQP